MKITATQLADVLNRLPHPARHDAPYIRMAISEPGPDFPYPNVTATEASKHTLTFTKSSLSNGDEWVIEIKT